MSSKKIWVLGGGGQIGEGLLTHHWNADVRYFSKEECNILNSDLEFYFDCDTIVDLVPSPFVSNASMDPAWYDQTYTAPHVKFMSRALAGGVKNYIFTSSGGSVYGDAPTGVNITESYPTGPVSSYGKSKIILENALMELSEKYESRYIILRPGSAFNANPRSPRQRGLIGALLNCFLNDKTFSLYGSFDIAKDYISNVDVGSAIIKAAHYDKSGIFNIGTGHAYSIKEVIDLFESKFKKKLSLVHNEAIQSDVAWYCLDSTKASEAFGFKVETPLTGWLDSITKESH